MYFNVCGKEKQHACITFYEENTLFSAAASSTTAVSTTEVKTEPKPSSNNPANWTIEEVIRYVSESDSALAAHTDLFRNQVSYLGNKPIHRIWLYQK